MAAWTDYCELACLDFYFRNIDFTKPVGLEVSWHTASPTDTGSLANEVDLTGGARLGISFPNASGRQTSNTGTFTIPSSNATANCTHWAIHRTDLASQMLCYAAIDGGMNVTVGVPVTIDPGAMVWDWPDSDALTDYLVNNWISHVLGVAAGTRPTSWQHSLHNGIPGQNGAFEFTGGGYSRNTGITWEPAADAGDGFSWTRNVADSTFTALAASDTPIEWWGVWDQGTNFLAKRNQTTQIVDDGDNATAPAQSLQIKVA